MSQHIAPQSRIAVAMSGGVDSSVAALRLKACGYDVFGVTMSLWSCHASERARKQTCCSTLDVEDARAVCARLDIPHVVADFRTEFRAQVVEPFVGEYARGRTPIPCIGCNQYFKFDRLWSYVRDEFDADYIATGHYARILRNGSGHQLQRSRDPKKDQTYYLFVMTQAQLAHSLFPLGELTKSEVRTIAAAHGLQTAQKPESFEICFVPDNDYAGFIEDYHPEQAGRPGNFLDQTGAVVGQHRGTHAYTIGQRRGLGDFGQERRYVTQINSEGNTVTIGGKPDLQGRRLVANDFHWILPPQSRGDGLRASAKIRAQHSAAGCRIDASAADGRVTLEFDDPQEAITPGQAVVVYDNDVVLGGGWIV